MNKDRNTLHLLHIRDAVEQIQTYSQGLSFEKFAEGGLEFDAIMMQIIVIGESVNSLSDEFKETHAHLPWNEAIGLRNQTAHGYLDIKPKIVWQTIQEDLPSLQEKVLEILGE